MTTSRKPKPDISALLMLYGQYWQEKHYDKASKVTDILLSRYPDNMALFWYRCCILEKLNLRDQALSEIQTRYRAVTGYAVEIPGHDDFELFTITLQEMPADICKKMIAAFDSEKKLLAIFNHLIALNPNAIEWYIQRAKYYYYSYLFNKKRDGLTDVNNSQYRLENILLDYQKVIELVPDKIESYICLAKVLHLLNRYDDALEVYDQALQIKPDDHSFKDIILKLRKNSVNHKQTQYDQIT